MDAFLCEFVVYYGRIAIYYVTVHYGLSIPAWANFVRGHETSSCRALRKHLRAPLSLRLHVPYALRGALCVMRAVRPSHSRSFGLFGAILGHFEPFGPF